MPLVKRAPEAAPSVVQTGSKGTPQDGGKPNSLPIDQLSAQLHRIFLSKKSQEARQTPKRSLSTSSVSDDNPGLATSPYSASSPEESVINTPSAVLSRTGSGYFGPADRVVQGDDRSVKAVSVKRASRWSGISASSSSPVSRSGSIHDEEVPPMPTWPPPALPKDELPRRNQERSKLTSSSRRGSTLAADDQDGDQTAPTQAFPAQEARELVLPSQPPEVAPATKQKLPDLDDEDLEAGPATRATVEEETESSVASKASSWIRTKAWYTRVYAPSVTPPIVLPTAPTDDEKVTYLKTNRLGLHGLGILAFLSLSAGMWLFVISSIAFYWFGAFVVFLQVYMIVSYLTSICGGEFDMTEHQKALDEHPIDALTAPEVDILLPVCMEPIEILENTWNHVKALDWPQDKIKVWVLDDGDSDAVKAMAAEERFNFNYICRDNRPLLKKAGNLRYAFARTNAPFFAIFDADFCPRTDFLKEIMPEHMAHPDTCIVQTPQFFRTTSDQSWVEQGAGAVQEVFYRVVQTNRNKWGASVCVGSNAVYRRESLLEVGGTAEIGFSEDVHTGFYAMCRGWKLRYMPIVLACGVCPDTPRAYFSQQMRWAMGSTTLVTNPEFWKSPLTRMQKICFLCGLLYYSAISLSIFMAPLPGMLLVWIRPDYVRYYNLAFAVPSVLFGILVIRCWTKAEYGWNVNFVQQVQMYAYLAAIKKRLLRKGLTWVASGDNKVHKSNEYREMLIVAWIWNITTTGLITAGIIYQTLRHRLHWYDTMPLVALTAFNLFLAHRFLLWHGRI